MLRVEELPCGARIDDVDLASDLAPSVIDELRRAYARYGLLVFESQQIDADRQIEVGSWFGPISRGSDGSALASVSNLSGVGFAHSPLEFHSDWTYTAAPLDGISLYGEEILGPGTPTVFASAVDAFERLRPEVQDEIRGLEVFQLVDHRPGMQGTRLRYLDLRPDVSLLDFPRAVHRLVTREPVARREAIFANRLQTSHVVGYGMVESESLLNLLFVTMYGEDFLYTHHWQQGDLLIWNNIAVQHMRRGVATEARRTLRRVVLSSRSGEPNSGPGSWDLRPEVERMVALMASYGQPSDGAQHREPTGV